MILFRKCAVPATASAIPLAGQDAGAWHRRPGPPAALLAGLPPPKGGCVRRSRFTGGCAAPPVDEGSVRTGYYRSEHLISDKGLEMPAEATAPLTVSGAGHRDLRVSVTIRFDWAGTPVHGIKPSADGLVALPSHRGALPHPGDSVARRSLLASRIDSAFGAVHGRGHPANHATAGSE
jgi:hypothetical protein